MYADDANSALTIKQWLTERKCKHICILNIWRLITDDQCNYVMLYSTFSTIISICEVRTIIMKQRTSDSYKLVDIRSANKHTFNTNIHQNIFPTSLLSFLCYPFQ